MGEERKEKEEKREEERAKFDCRGYFWSPFQVTVTDLKSSFKLGLQRRGWKMEGHHLGLKSGN